ncbi:MAG: methionyl-tRNA formyltransferase [Betaproteobacteria bacterium]|nr:methionyl-tRNA formyltransferase [Betaproteobacteria bacterium]
MRVAFAGTPEFAVRALEAILAAGFSVPLVLTQPDRPSGRGLRLNASPVKMHALAAKLPVLQVPSLRDPGARAEVCAYSVDVLVVAAYGLILPKPILDWPARGCLNIHASLLPRWRGAAPIQRALLAGDATTGISIMQMDEGLDTGPVRLSEAVPIDVRENSGSLHEKLATLGARLIVDVLNRLEAGAIPPEVPQANEGVSYAHKLGSAEAQISWSHAADIVERQIRAFSPAPGAVAQLAGRSCKIWRAEVASGQGEPGMVLEVGSDHWVVACGQGALRVLEIQPAGARPMTVAAYLAGHQLQVGMRMA